MSIVKSVWIDDGCICCLRCVVDVPIVFSLPDDGAVVLGSVRVDGVTSANCQERSDLKESGRILTEGIIDAAVNCPVEVIKFLVAV